VGPDQTAAVEPDQTAVPTADRRSRVRLLCRRARVGSVQGLVRRDRLHPKWGWRCLAQALGLMWVEVGRVCESLLREADLLASQANGSAEGDLGALADPHIPNPLGRAARWPGNVFPVECWRHAWCIFQEPHMFRRAVRYPDWPPSCGRPPSKPRTKSMELPAYTERCSH
jgi:hypothetical protein